MKTSGWDLAAKIAGGCDRVLNAVIAIVLAVAMLFGAFGLWDTWRIYRNAGLDADLLQHKPTAENPSLDELRQINPDVYGWLTVDDTKIDYPVLQGADNDYYVNRDVYGEFCLTGSLFLDYRNASDFSDSYSLIYGHHIEGKVMFGQLTDFLEEDFFESHSTGTLFTVDTTYSLTWFACVETDAYDTNIYVPDKYTSGESMQTLLTYVKQSATQYRDIGVSASDKILALTTCSGTGTDGRVVLFGRMSPSGQS